MIRKVAEYKIRAGERETVESAISVFVAAIASNEPNTVYAAYRRQDEQSYIHFMAFPDRTAEQAHRDAAHTARFVEVLYPRCETSPSFKDLTLISSTGSRG